MVTRGIDIQSSSNLKSNATKSIRHYGIISIFFYVSTFGIWKILVYNKYVSTGVQLRHWDISSLQVDSGNSKNLHVSRIRLVFLTLEPISMVHRLEGGLFTHKITNSMIDYKNESHGPRIDTTTRTALRAFRRNAIINVSSSFFHVCCLSPVLPLLRSNTI